MAIPAHAKEAGGQLSGDASELANDSQQGSAITLENTSLRSEGWQGGRQGHSEFQLLTPGPQLQIHTDTALGVSSKNMYNQLSTYVVPLLESWDVSCSVGDVVAGRTIRAAALRCQLSVRSHSYQRLTRWLRLAHQL